MSQTFIPVQWNRQKKFYDGLLLVGIALYLATFIFAGLAVKAADPAILILRALGSGALILLHIILAIGPLARLSDRMKPLLYNRRHFGVMTALLALAHAGFALMWYHGAGVINPISSAIGGYGDYGQALEIPFEGLGLIALFILLVMAATSHDFWLARLTPPVWKALHMSIYPAYALLLAHVALGTAQFDKSTGLLWALVVGATTLCSLHILAILKNRKLDIGQKTGDAEWLSAGAAAAIPLNKAVTVLPNEGQRIAVFRHERGISAVMGVCAHQNGPLGEGCIIDGLITCPWHGFQFDPETGAAPAPFTDKVQTHEVKVDDGEVWVRATPDAFGMKRDAVKVTS